MEAKNYNKKFAEENIKHCTFKPNQHTCSEHISHSRNLSTWPTSVTFQMAPQFFFFFFKLSHAYWQLRSITIAAKLCGRNS